ncbi:MAG: hypoxanthine phosphoribosyltransferase [Anaerolineales bacterium]|nr:hypoxanthine phosphoribosyltransferase [Anaerolineales bacterium]
MRLHPLEDYQVEADHIDSILYTPEEIEARVWELGAKISADYADLSQRGERLVLVGLLRGVIIFMADLLRAITIPVEVEFMDINQYASESKYGGTLNLATDMHTDIEGRHVLFVEDVIDKGLTLNHLLRNLRARRPASLKVCTMFDKPARRLIDIPITYIGFELPDKFVVGYGLDYHEQYRNLPFLALLKPEVFEEDVLLVVRT